MSNKRVVITGLGILSPVGNNIEDSWKNILKGNSSVKDIPYFDTTNFETKFAASLTNFNPKNYLESKEIRRLDPFVQYGVAVSKDCLVDSGIDLNTVDLTRIGVSLGSGIGGLGTIQ